MGKTITISLELYGEAERSAVLEERSVAGQIEFWVRVGRAALAHPAFPAELVAQALDHLEDLEDAQTVRERANGPFVEVSLDEL